jgi:hypothetical protein
VVNVQSNSSAHDLSSLHRFSSKLLQKVAGDERKGNVLIVGHGALPAPDCPCLSRDERTFGLAICVFQGQLRSAERAETLLDCNSAALPFQDAAFRRVILFLITRNGTERELEEACRVLAPGGELLVLGLNRSSWSGLHRYRGGPVPRMNVASVRNSLQAHGMDLNHVLGAGLLGWARPVMEWKRLSGIALPLADLVVLRARHRDRPAVTRLQMKKFPARALPTAVKTSF